MLNNPIIKTALSVVVGGLAATIDGAVQHPSGGTAAWIASAPTHGILWMTFSLFVHNIASQAQYAKQ